MLIDEVRRLLEFMFLELTMRADDAVLHLLLIHHEDHEDALIGEGEKFDLTEGDDFGTRQGLRPPTV